MESNKAAAPKAAVPPKAPAKRKRAAPTVDDNSWFDQEFPGLDQSKYLKDETGRPVARNVYVIDQILECRHMEPAGKEYKVRWVGWTSHGDTNAVAPVPVLVLALQPPQAPGAPRAPQGPLAL